MSTSPSNRFTAFAGSRQIARGSLIEVALAVKAAEPASAGEPILVFDDGSGAVVDLDLRGSAGDLAARLGAAAGAAVRSRGRPKLGVVAREVTLLPRHWEWLAAQAGGASQALRRLVDQARRSDEGQSRARIRREAAYRFLSAVAGDLPGFEEAIRALFAGDHSRFSERMAAWPPDISTYASRLAGDEGADEETRS